MPLHEYECDQCGHRFEVIQKFSDPPVETCPKCGSRVRKLISSPAFQFKGSGFYITDYPKGGKKTDDKDTKDTKDTKDAKDAKDTKDTKDTKTEKPAGDTSSASTPAAPASSKKEA